MENLEKSIACHESKLKLIGLLGIAAALVVGSAFVVSLPGWKAQMAGWAGIIFFGFVFVGIVTRFFRRGARVVIDENGVDDKRFNIGPIAWEHIEGVSEGDINGTKFVCLHVVDPEYYLQKMTPWKRKMAKTNPPLGFPEFSFSVVGLTPGHKDVLAFITKQMNAPQTHTPEALISVFEPPTK